VVVFNRFRKATGSAANSDETFYGDNKFVFDMCQNDAKQKEN